MLQKFEFLKSFGFDPVSGAVAARCPSADSIAIRNRRRSFLGRISSPILKRVSPEGTLRDETIGLAPRREVTPRSLLVADFQDLE